jgi:hypothetical protein
MYEKRMKIRKKLVVIHPEKYRAPHKEKPFLLNPI